MIPLRKLFARQLREFEEKFLCITYKEKGDIRSFLSTCQRQIIEEVKEHINEEILICHHENTPTSRLTSLWNKIILK